MNCNELTSVIADINTQISKFDDFLIVCNVKAGVAVKEKISKEMREVYGNEFQKFECKKIYTDNLSNRMRVAIESNDGKNIISGSVNSIDTKTIFLIWDKVSGKLESAPYEQEGDITGLSQSTDGKRIFSSSNDGVLRVWDRERRILEKKALGRNLKMTASTDGRFLALGYTDGIWGDNSVPKKTKIEVYDTDTLQLIQSSEDSNNDMTIYSVAMSPDGKKIVSAGLPLRVKIWEIVNQKLICTKNFDSHGVRNVILSADEKTIIGGGDFGYFYMWDVEGSIEKSFRVTNDNQEIKSIVETSDGNNLIIGLAYGDIKIWNKNLQRCVKTLSHEGGSVNSIFFSNGEIISAGNDKTVRRWGIPEKN